MIELIVLCALQDVIANMARRRDRSTALFRTMLFLCWFAGEFAGGVAGYLLSWALHIESGLFVACGVGLLGGFAGAVLAFLWAKLQAPLNGEWRDLSEFELGCSRVLGALVGGVGGLFIGAGIVAVLFNFSISQQELTMMVQVGAGASFWGALLGLISGVQTDQLI